MSAKAQPRPAQDRVTVDLSAVVVAVAGDTPRVLALRGADGVDALPAGPLEPQHRTLELGLRAWVETQTGQRLGYVEQLYTFGDRDRQLAGPDRMLSVGYLALVREAASVAWGDSLWSDWYRHFPWEDRRDGRPALLDRIEPGLAAWAAAATTEAERRSRDARLRTAFGLGGMPWGEERVLERYELLYEAGLAAEAQRHGQAAPGAADGAAMAADHRRILATAIGRLRGKIKYRPVVFELMPPTFTLSQLQRTVEALAGLRLHAPNFRRLVDSQGLVEETGEVAGGTGGRPARLVRFRREVLQEQPEPGVKLPLSRRPA
ncbi:hypothetical protein E9232_000210 [Inquilinus ginsengisoli]|uniref:NrtR DNA-binding winged helix domain-containing protein n=1 Tax=Inquilinus ginsengisoli TaxID=363840 RepID=A0ABU1JGM8_9PROT|nr:hypothetical protein [Inquilinus ginsengisoli]MDR6287711.1 hypothetical protein [Inquilinus ginsengisoli]